MSTNPTIRIIQPEGVLDSQNAPQVRQEINDCLEAGAQAILLDLKDVTFIDSSGLGALVSSLKTINSTGSTLYLCSISDQVRMLFELTSMDRVFKIFADREAFERAMKLQ